MKPKKTHESTQAFKAPYLLGMRRSALMETVAFLVLALLIDSIFAGGTRFWEVSPHPFWVIIVLVSAQYGTREGVFAAFLSTVLLLAGNMPAQGLQLDAFDYALHVSRLPLLWFVSAVILGELRVRQLRERKELLDRVHAVEKREATFIQSYNQLKDIKEYLEVKLAGHLRSSISMYEAMQHIEKFDPMEVLLGVDDIINSMMEPDKLSVYALGANGFEAASCTGWEKDDHYARRFTQESALFREVAGRHRILCVLNEEDEAILNGEGVLAGPLIDKESGDIFGMLKIEDMSFLDLTLTNVEIFKILCEWIGMAYAQAVKFQRARANTIRDMDKDCLSASFGTFIRPYLHNMTHFCQHPMSEYTLTIEGMSGLRNYKQNAIYKTLYGLVMAELEEKALLCAGDNNETQWQLLLPGYTQAEVERLQRAIATRLVKEQAHDESLLAVQLVWAETPISRAA